MSSPNAAISRIWRSNAWPSGRSRSDSCDGCGIAGSGYDPLLERRMELLLPVLKRKRVRLISNFGSANPVAAGERIVEIARRLRLRGEGRGGHRR